MTDTMQDTATETATTGTTLVVPQQEPPLPEALGARRIAGLLADHVGEPVTAADVDDLVAQEHLEVVDHYKGWPMYSTAAALALDTDLVRSVVADRLAWEAASLPRDAAADRIGWHWSDLVRMGEEGRITTGRGGRYLIADLDTMAAEADGEQYVTAQAAATDVLEIRPSDWKYVLDAGWITPATYVQSQVGSRRWIDIPLFTTRDVEALRDLPGAPWEEVRAVRPGAPSPLREFVSRQPSRAELVHGFAGALADRHHVEVWAHHDERTGCWELDWMRDDQGNPGVGAVLAELRADPAVARFTSDIRLGNTLWGRRARWARPLLMDGVGVVLCTRTSGPSGVESVEDEIVEVAVVDIASGAVLLDRPVRPGSPLGERRVHEISDADLERALPWEKVLPMVRRVTRERLIVPCRPERDRGSITADTERSGKRLMHLGTAESWALPPQEKPLESVVGWPARRGAVSVREALVRLAKGRGRSHLPQDPGLRG
ncbi:hypothetical protein [Streptomyces sp. WM6378]|uniref:hypothetical protein n=1 Tax=Streptomyces sp. WM6378 TaxID=1415557 RepID=UPI0006AD9116|nr:hypothetical protein [Streptomyces sp. WM6378]